MINITNKIECCGCQACGDICSKKAISFKSDEEGIWYPVVDKGLCVDCGLCEKVCPIINRTSCPTNAKTPECYVLQAPSSYDRLQSASGAAYTLLARAIFEKGGFVAGHIWDDNFGVKGYISGDSKDLEMLRGTKYLQSNVEGVYIAVRNLLKEGKIVLFSGTPCQNAAMRSFLRKDYDNLIMTDFVCMGIDSPLAFKKYIESLENQYKSKIVYFKAKSKEVGWRYLTNKAVFENGKSYFGINGIDANLNATFLNVLVRPSCYDCKFKGFPRVSDMTIGDYWRRRYDNDPLDDNTGTSYIMIHNEKAKKLFEAIEKKCIHRKVTFEDIISANRHALQSLPQPSFSRKEFYERLKHEDFAKLVESYFHKKKCGTSFTQKIKKYLFFIAKVSYYNRKYPLSIVRSLYYNFFSKQVKSNILEGDILLLRNVKLKMEEGTTINVKGICIFDSKNVRSHIILGKKATLSLCHNKINEGVSIIVHDSSSLTIGFKSIIKKCSTLYTRSKIAIGEFSVLGEDVLLDSTNSGITYFEEKNKENTDIELGTHVLLNKGCIINGGTRIGDETIVREYSVVEGVVASQNVIAGNPATIVDKNIFWKHNFDFIWNYKN